jgi:DNA polymerase-3 subunit epsilon
MTKTILANLSNQPASEMKLAKKDAIRTAREILALGPVYLDTETTGLGSNAQVVDIAIINYDGTELIKTLVRPTVPIPVEATSVHGITDEDVSTAPTFADISPNLNSYSNRLIVIYNRDYDLRVCRQSAKAHGIEPWAPPETVCAMELYAKFYGEWNDHHKFYRWQKQSDAARRLGIDIPADLHRAAADANLCRLIVEAMAATPLPGEENLTREKLVEMIIGLYAALECRNDCQNCGGKGGGYVTTGDYGEDTEYEACSCVSDADEILNQYKADFSEVTNEYLRINDLDPDEIGKRFEKLAYGLLEGLLEEIKRKHNG